MDFCAKNIPLSRFRVVFASNCGSKEFQFGGFEHLILEIVYKD